MQRLRSSIQGNERPNILVWELDLSRHASVIAFTEKAQRELERIDGVVLNAAVETVTFELAEGLEKTVTVNVVSTILLAVLLLPKMRETAGKFGSAAGLGGVPHVSIVGSIVHRSAKAKDLSALKEGGMLTGLSDKKRADMKDRYNMSKLLVMFCVRELAARIEEAKRVKGKAVVVINNPAPGWCRTELFRETYDTWPPPQKLAFRMMAREAEDGARTLVHGVVAGRESQGQYLSECVVKQPSPFVRSREGAVVQKRLWEEVVGKLEDIRPGVTELI